MKLTAAVLVLALFGVPSGWSAELKAHHRWKTLWIISGVVLTAATFLDAASSAGQREANPVLQNSQGLFSSARGMALKGGMLSGTLIVQALLERKSEGNAKSFAVTNFAAAAALGGIAWHNYAIQKSSLPGN
jgi:hypothetical protein